VFSKPIRVAIVTSIHNDFDPRIWKHTTSLLRNGNEVHLFSPWKISKTNMPLGIYFHCFRRVNSRWQRPWKIPFLLIRKLLPEIPNVDIVHFHDIDILPWMVLISFFKPVVYDVHENYPDEMLDRFWIPDQIRRIMYHIVRHAQYFFSSFIKNLVFVTPDQEKDFKHIRFNKILLYNYASRDLIKLRKDDYLEREDIIIFTGAHYVSNGTYLILDIADRLRYRCPHAKILITDRFSGELKKMVEQEIKLRHLKGIIKIISQVRSDEIMCLLNKATIGLCPNLRVSKQLIAIPTKIFEYMAAGLPIVASDLGEQKKIISLTKSGILAQPENPDSFVAAIQKLIKNKRLAKELGEYGLSAFNDKYNWECQISQIERYYQSIIFRNGFFKKFCSKV